MIFIMEKLINVFRVYDLLYYASYRICMKSKNFSTEEAGYWLTETSEMIGIISICFIVMGMFSINLDWLIIKWRSYVILVMIIIRLLSRLLQAYHLNRHDAIMKKYSHITSLRTCWLIFIAYSIVTSVLIVLAGVYYNHTR